MRELPPGQIDRPGARAFGAAATSDIEEILQKCALSGLGLSEGDEMGGVPYYYFVPYERDIDAALQTLRAREFEAGRYNPAVRFPDFPVTSASPAPGRKHTSIREALEASMEDGTRSILDIKRVSPRPGYSVAAPLPPDRLRALFGTDQPTRSNVEENMDFFEDIDRGHAIYIIVYENGRPSEIFFGGYSYD